MKKIWNKPSIEKLSIGRATLGGVGMNIEMTNGGDAAKYQVS